MARKDGWENLNLIDGNNKSLSYLPFFFVCVYYSPYVTVNTGFVLFFSLRIVEDGNSSY